MADLDDFDDFVEIAPTAAKTHPSAAITFGTVSLRGGIEKISLSFSAAAIARLDGWPRFAIAWSAKALALRIRADAAGAYEAFKAIKGERYVLRVALPAELRHVPKLKEPAPYRYGEDGRTVFITAPPAFRPPPEPVRPKTHAEMIAAAKAAVPAPEFGSRRNGGGR